MTSTYPTSLAMCESTPAKTTTIVKSLRGAESTTARRVAEMSPLPSATAMPSMATSTVPSGAKPVKFVTREVSIRCSPATVRRLSALTTAFVPGWTTETPSPAVIAESTTTKSARMTNKVAGCGRMFPALSMNPSRRFRKESFAGGSSPASGLTVSIRLSPHALPQESAAGWRNQLRL
jgi:hypothetical protein